MIEQRVKAVFARSAAFHEGDQERALAAEAVDEARGLWEAVRLESPEPGIPFYVVAAIAILHWCRYGAMPRGRDHNDLQVAAIMYSHILTVDPDPVPENLKKEIARVGVESFEDDFGIPAWFDGSYAARHYPSSTDPIIATGPTWWARRAEVILQRSRSFSDPSEYDEAVSLLRRASDAEPGPLSEPAEHLYALGSALFARFQQFGTVEADGDLDEAIEHLRSAVRKAPNDNARQKVFMKSLGGAVALRFDRTGRQVDYEEATAITTLLRREDDGNGSRG